MFSFECDSRMDLQLMQNLYHQFKCYTESDLISEWFWKWQKLNFGGMATAASHAGMPQTTIKILEQWSSLYLCSGSVCLSSWTTSAVMQTVLHIAAVCSRDEQYLVYCIHYITGPWGPHWGLGPLPRYHLTIPFISFTLFAGNRPFFPLSFPIHQSLSRFSRTVTTSPFSKSSPPSSSP